MLKKLLSLICSAAIAAAAVSSFRVSAEDYEIKTVERHEPDSMLILGDSIASGYGLEGYDAGDNKSTNNYGAQLAESYGLTNDTYRNFSVDGLTSSELLESLENGIYDDYLSCELIVISIGGNDLLDVLFDSENGIASIIDFSEISTGNFNFLSKLTSSDFQELASKVSSSADEAIENYGANLDNIISYIKEHNTQAQIIVQNLYNPMNTRIKAIDNLYESKISDINEIINQSDNCFIADIYTPFSESETNLIQNDFTHPNSSGHAVIYNAVCSCIAENCIFYDEYKVSTTVVEVAPEKSHLNQYFTAIFIFGGLIVIILTSEIIKFITKRKNKE